MRVILNNTIKHSDRYSLINEGQGGYGDPLYYPTHKFCVVNGIDRGNGYQGYLSVTYALQHDSVPKEVKARLKALLIRNGYSKYLSEVAK